MIYTDTIIRESMKKEGGTMTNEEAIYCFNHPTEYCTSEREEAIKLAIEALEKQIPKKPEQRNKFDFCPNCEHWFDEPYDVFFCPDCGQKIDWN